MAMWKDEHTAALITLLKNSEKLKDFDTLCEKFRDGQPYKGSCKHCSARTFTNSRILTKSRKLIAAANRNAKTKGLLAVPLSRKTAQKMEADKEAAAARLNSGGPKLSKEEKLEQWILGNG